MSNHRHLIIKTLAVLVFIAVACLLWSLSKGSAPVISRISAEPPSASRVSEAAPQLTELAVDSAGADSHAVDASQRTVSHLAPPSLAGIEPPPLRWADDGSLLTDYSSRAWLEFFRSVPGEQLAEAQNYKSALLQQMTPSQRHDLHVLESLYRELLEAEYQINESYSAYGVDAELQRAMQGEGHDENAWKMAQERLAARQQIRRDILGEALSEAWFDQDEAMENYTMAALKIARNPTLSDSTKAEQVAQLDHMLPEAIQQSMALSRQSANMAMQVTQWQNEGWSETEIQEAIELIYGREIAMRWQAAGE